MKLDWFSVTVTILFIAIIVGVSISVTHKVIEPFTEVYFNDFKTLPKIISDNVSFSYTINNLEGNDFSYEVNITAELYDKNTTSIIELKQQKLDIKKDQNFTSIEKFSINTPFEKAKIIVSLDNKNQEIHFWSYYARDTFTYKDYGLVSFDCLRPAVFVNSNKLSLLLRANYGDGWPYAIVLLDGVTFANISVDSNKTKAYDYNLNLKPGLHVLDIVFANDKYQRDETGKVIIDRNLYVDMVIIGNQLYGIIDQGSNFGAFDCQDTTTGTGLYAHGSYRVRFIT